MDCSRWLALSYWFFGKDPRTTNQVPLAEGGTLVDGATRFIGIGVAGGSEFRFAAAKGVAVFAGFGELETPGWAVVMFAGPDLKSATRVPPTSNAASAIPMYSAGFALRGADVTTAGGRCDTAARASGGLIT